MPYFGFVFVVFGTLEEFDQLYYHLVKLPLFAFGIAGFFWSSLNAVGARYAYKLKDKPWIFYLFPLLSALGIVIVACFPSVPIIGVLWFSYLLAAPLQVLVESRIQHNIKSISRATVTSINAFFLNLAGALLAPVLGLIGKVFNLLQNQCMNIFCELAQVFKIDLFHIVSWCMPIIAGVGGYTDGNNWNAFF